VFEKSCLRAEYWVLFVNLPSFIVSHFRCPISLSAFYLEIVKALFIVDY